MKAYYGRTIFGMAALLVIVLVAAAFANSAAGDAKKRLRRLGHEGERVRGQYGEQAQKLRRLQQAMGPVREFAAGWASKDRLPEREAAEQIRSELEGIAQRQLGLVTDNAITPQSERYTFQAVPLRVQRVTLRASGKDLSALLVWLGKVEEKFPAAVIEWCEFSSNVGGNTGLTIRLIQPLAESSARRPVAAPSGQDASLICESIGSIPWPRYAPARIKAAVPVGLARNPLQPVITGDQRMMPILRDPADEISSRLETALDGRIRSVVRGSAAIVVVDNRVFRVGDELVLGVSRDRPVPGAKTKLKHIGDDGLVFHIAGGTSDKPVQCDVVYTLPSFLRTR